jgi:chromosome segregation ATPase
MTLGQTEDGPPNEPPKGTETTVPTEAEYFEAAKRSFDDARQQLLDTAQRMDTYQAALLDPEGPLARMGGAVEHMANQVTALTGKVDALSNEKSKVSRRLKRLDARVGAIEERLELLEDDEDDDAPESTPAPPG